MWSFGQRGCGCWSFSLGKYKILMKMGETFSKFPVEIPFREFIKFRRTLFQCDAWFSFFNTLSFYMSDINEDCCMKFFWFEIEFSFLTLYLSFGVVMKFKRISSKQNWHFFDGWFGYIIINHKCDSFEISHQNHHTNWLSQHIKP